MHFYSKRFEKNVRVTFHAAQRMEARSLSEKQLSDLIETGTIKPKDKTRLWIYKEYPERKDNLVCVAVVLEIEVVVKTVMINWELRSEICESAMTQKRTSSLLN